MRLLWLYLLQILNQRQFYLLVYGFVWFIDPAFDVDMNWLLLIMNCFSSYINFDCKNQSHWWLQEGFDWLQIHWRQIIVWRYHQKNGVYTTRLLHNVMECRPRDDHMISQGSLTSNRKCQDYVYNIIKWPMTLGARPRSIKNVNKIL